MDAQRLLMFPNGPDGTNRTDPESIPVIRGALDSINELQDRTDASLMRLIRAYNTGIDDTRDAYAEAEESGTNPDFEDDDRLDAISVGGLSDYGLAVVEIRERGYDVVLNNAEGTALETTVAFTGPDGHVYEPGEYPEESLKTERMSDE